MSVALASTPLQQDVPDKTITADSEIKKVVLFSDRAQVFRTGKVLLKNGDYTIVFNGLWNSVNRDTLQVATSAVAGAAIILRSVQFTTINEVVDVRPQRREMDEKIKALDEPLRNVQDEIAIEDRAIADFAALKAKLTDQMSSGASPKGSPFVYDPSLWVKFSDFIKQGTSDHRDKKRDAERRKTALEQEKRDLEDSRRRLGSADEKRTSREVAEVVLTVLADKADREICLDLMLSYMVSGCSWKPSYDIRIDKANKQMSVTYNAVVQQRSEDWNDVRLELSTAKAHVGGEIPDFTSPWYLRRRQVVYSQFEGLECDGISMRNEMSMSNMMMQQMMPAAPAAPGGGGGSGGNGGARNRPAFASATSVSAQVNAASSTSCTFTIQALATVLADNEPVKVTIALIDLPIHFRYSAVPKLDPNVYLKVKAVNSTDFPMLQGKSNIFADEQLVGRSEMDDVAPGEEFWTFLGMDGSVTCTRKEISKKHVEISGGFLGKPKTRIEYSYKFTCKNVKSSQEELVIWDQMPISEDQRIAVSLITPNKDREGLEPANPVKDGPLFKINEVKFIEWFVYLKPSEERTFDFSFHVEHPQENQITI